MSSEPACLPSLDGHGHSRGSNGEAPILLTGVTGFVGMEVLARFLARSARRIYTLIRADSDDAAAGRLRAVLATTFGDPDAYPGRVVAVAGDIERPGLGLDQRRGAELAREVTAIVHSAASVSFALGLDESRGINVIGTRNMLEFAELCQERGGLARFTYVSTAYVAGKHRGDFGEDDYDVGQSFRNPYELTKFESEGMVRETAEWLPVQIVRPSIIVGEQASGWTVAFNVLYGPIRAFARGAYKAVPLNLSAPVDVVPIDYVADGLFELASRGPLGTFHLVAGERATTAGRLAELSAEHFHRPLPWIVPAGVYRVLYPLLRHAVHGRQRLALERSQVFMPYFNIGVRFRDARTRERLAPAGIEVRPVDEYFPRLLDFAEAAEWGRRPLPHPRSAKRDHQPEDGQVDATLPDDTPESAAAAESSVAANSATARGAAASESAA